MRLPPCRKVGLIPLHCVKSNSVLPIKQVRSVDLLDVTAESPQEHCHKSRRTLMSPYEAERDRCTPIQLEIKHDDTALVPEPFCFPQHIEHVA